MHDDYKCSNKDNEICMNEIYNYYDESCEGKINIDDGERNMNESDNYDGEDSYANGSNINVYYSSMYYDK